MRLRGLPGLLLLAAILLFVIPSVASFYTDWLWFRELGYEGVFLRALNAQTAVFAGTFAAVYLFLFLNLRFARRRTEERPRVVIGTGGDGRPLSVDGRQLASLANPISIVAAMLVGFMGASNWLPWLSFFHHVAFNVSDPIFHRDVSFYVFRLPIFQLVRQQALIVTLIALVGCGIYYVFSGSFVIEARPAVSSWPRLRLIPSARRHLSLLTAVLLGLFAWGSWLDIPSTLLTPTDSSVAFGAGYSDLYAGIPFLWLTFGTLVVGAALCIWHGFGRRAWPLPLALATYVVISIGGTLYTGFVQRLIVTPNEQDRERPYIQHNIESTRRAYALDRVDERDLSGNAELTARDIAENAGTIENVRLWDHAPLLQTFGQIQEIRTYYDFLNIDNDRYTLDGKYRQVMLSARELNTTTMPNKSWVNEKLMYTHGYGLTLGPVNQVTTEGLPVLFIRDLPPVSTVNLHLNQPSIYYGEVANSEYVIVKTRQPEFHYPKGDNNEMTFYEGSGGVPTGSFLRRLLFAIRFASTDILVTGQLTPESRIMFHRNIVERAKRLAPFLTLDADPYPVVTNSGGISWIQDAYTTASSYPYATPYSGPSQGFTDVNYIRNSVKIVTDAYNGSVSMYVSEPDDPLVLTISRIFPGLLKPLSDMPADLRQHIRYPEDIFGIQAFMYATYHMTNPQVFYNKEDQWSVPVLDSGQSSKAMEPYYTVMRLPGEKQNEFIQMLPFTPRLKDNLSAWMVARSDGAHYGHMLVYQFPKQSLVFGPRQIVGKINQDQLISPQITLWSQQGSEVNWGQLLVIPVNKSLLYVRALYLKSPEGKIPELKRVVVAYQSRIVMAETLTRALVSIFGPTVAGALAPDQLSSSATSVVETPQEIVAPPPVTVGTPTPCGVLATLATEAQAHLDSATKAQRAGDWALYGEEMKKLEATIACMQSPKP
ncbi:MAG: UPF0182 family protein [Acidobacteriota bacterium]